MRVGIDIRHLAKRHYSGVDIYTIQLIEALAVQYPNDEFFLFASGSASALQHVPTFDFPNVRRFTKRLPNKLIFLLLKLPFGPSLEDWMEEKPDLWLFPNFNILRTQLPYLLTVHDLSFFLYPEFYTVKNRLKHWMNAVQSSVAQATTLLAVSESTKQDLVSLLGVLEKNIRVTPLGVESHYHPKQQPSDAKGFKSYAGKQPSDATFRKHYRLPQDYFLTLCTREPRKNLASVVDAYDSWRHTHNDKAPPHLVLAGGVGWNTSDLKTALKHAWFKDDIHVIGYVKEHHKAALYRGARAFFFPSFYEGFGLPALEAMACGTPVVTSFTGSMPEVVGNAAIMVDPYNITDLEQTFEQLPSIEDQLRVQGPLQAAKFTWKKTANITHDALFQIGAVRR